MKENLLQIEHINIKELHPYQRNAKQHTQEQIEQIKKSIETYGNNDPIAVWGKNNIIVEGHGRYEALKQLGYSEVEIIRLDHLSDKQRREYTLVHNQLTMNTEWDIDKLGLELEGLDFDGFDFGFDVDLPSFEEDAQKEVVEDDYDEEPPIEPKAKLGDLWILGSHRLVCGDSTDPAVIDRLMDGVKADMVFTDPPYGNGTSGKYGRGQLGVRTIAGDEDLSAFNDFVSIMNTDKIVYFLQWRTLGESLETIRNKGLKVNTVAVWDKKNAGLNGGGGISEQWEAVIFAGNIKYKKFGGNVFSIAREQHKREDSPHPHQKPIKLLAEIFDFIDECKIVLDPFGGSGSTLIACEQLNRKCYMCELDPKYVSVILQRYINFKGSDEDVFLLKDGKKIPYSKVKS